MQLKIQQYCTPTGARLVFKLRPYQNFAIGIATFVLICLLLLLFLNAWVASGIAFLPSFGLYFFLESRAFIIKCPSCKKIIDTNTPWLCGFKSCRNENIDHQHPFIHECEHCHYIPKAYECHHCGKPIFLTTDKQKIHMAKFLVGQERVKVKRDVLGEKVATQKEEVSDLEHILKTETIKKQIRITKKPPAPPVIKSAEQALQDEIEECVNQQMSLDSIAFRLKEKASRELAGDQDKIERKHALIDNMIALRLE
jgi:hypothetical protein